MRINNTNLNFGKRLIGTCRIKDIDNKKHNASIYEYEPENYKDRDEIKASPYASAIKNDFCGIAAYGDYANFYVIKDDSSDSIIASSEVTNHIDYKYSRLGSYSEINAIQGDRNYKDVLTPLISHIAGVAYEKSSDYIVTYDENVSNEILEENYFQEVADRVWLMPEKKFHQCIENAAKTNSLDYDI